MRERDWQIALSKLGELLSGQKALNLIGSKTTTNLVDQTET